LDYVFNIPYRKNFKLKKIMERIKDNKKLQTYWKCANVMAIDRMGYTDHGPTHVKIVANLALKLLRILIEENVKPSIVSSYGLKNDDAEVVVVLGSVFHDIGMLVIRDNHEKYSAMLTLEFIDKLLTSVYSEEEKAIISSEVLHSVVAHEQPNRPLTYEAGIVGIADALDMESGRARIPFEAGKVDIHSISALSIEKVEIIERAEKPITIKISMSDAAGIFQIDELLKPRIEKSGLKKYFHVIAEVACKTDKKIIEKFEI
jgi:metal-dependent HD superfamily phosphatase/phosphodiesterase